MTSAPHGSVFLFGADAHPTRLFEYADDKWTYITDGPNKTDTASFYYDSSPYILSGYGDTGDDNLWSYNLIEMSWQSFSVSGMPVRSKHAAVMINDNTVLVYGGYDQNFAINDTAFLVHLGETPSFELLPHPAGSPPPLAGHAMVYSAKFDSVIMYGGVSAPQHGSDALWIYSVVFGAWMEMPKSGDWPPNLSAMPYASTADGLVMSCGCETERDGCAYPDTTWIMSHAQ